MTLLWIAIGTVEICVLLFIVAAAVLAAALRPGGRGQAETYLYAGDLMVTGESLPLVAVTVGDDYRAAVMRRGLGGSLCDDGAVSLAVTVIGTDVTIEERVTPGRRQAADGAHPDSAMFFLDCLPPETRIHFRYNASSFSSGASCSFTVRPGFSYTLPLSQ